jgi:hypothetical protein
MKVNLIPSRVNKFIHPAWNLNNCIRPDSIPNEVFGVLSKG